MIASIASAFVTALFLRDLGSIELCKILFSGYQASSPEVGRLMNGGGVISMIQVCCIISISCTFAGIFELTGMLRRLENGIAYLGAKAGVFLTITLTALATAALSCNQMLAVILTEQLCNKIQPDKIKMAASLENTAIVIAPLIPWSIAGAVPVATIGAPESCSCRSRLSLDASYLGHFGRKSSSQNLPDNFLSSLSEIVLNLRRIRKN